MARAIAPQWLPPEVPVEAQVYACNWGASY
jgi:hypothetical protein